MKTPSFWKDKNLASLLLSPIGCLYMSATFLRLKLKKAKKVEKKVICIGNITAGGTGKTPVSLAIAAMLQQMGKNPFFVSRGYGGKAQDILVDIKKDKAEVVGDEPLLLAQRAPVVINADRYKAAQKAIENGADIIVMDDGFQTPGLYKDISFLVFDGEFGIGNGFGVPAGPMRESFSQGLKRAQAVIIIGEDKHNIAAKLSALPVFYAKVVNEPINPQHKKAIAFAGIGRPQKFYNSLKQCGVEIVETIDFPDHHQYSKDELENLILRAKEKKAQLYTTTKDYVKIPQELRPHFNVLQIKIKWQDEKSLETFLKEKL